MADRGGFDEVRPVIAGGVAALILVVVTGLSPLSAQSDHDEPAAARVLVPVAAANGATVAVDAGSTVDTDDGTGPFPPVFSGGAVWWVWDAPSSVGTLTVSTEGSDFDTVLSVWRGEPGTLELVGWSDDVDFLGGALHSEVSIPVEVGQRYHIAVAGYLYSHRGETTPRAGDVSLSATWSPVELLTAIADGSSTARASTDGRYVAFATAARLLAADTDDLADVYRLDSTTGEVILVSAGDAERPGASSSPDISADGSVVAFVSAAEDLVDGDDNGELDVFVHDLATGELRLASRALDGSSGNSASISPSLAADGRRVAFTSFAADLSTDDTNGVVADVFVHDLDRNRTLLVSTGATGRDGTDAALNPQISADGTVVAFESMAAEFTDGDPEVVAVFVGDVEAGTLRPIPDGTTDAVGPITADPALSADGASVVVTSRPGETGPAEIVLHRFDGQSTTATTLGPGARPSISDDGRTVAYSVQGSATGPVTVVDVVLDRRTEVGPELSGDAQAVLTGDGSRLVVTAPGADERSGRVLLVDRGVPAQVTGLDVTAEDGRIELSWDSDDADDYEVRLDPFGGEVLIDGTTAEITGLTNGTAYRVGVRGLSVPGAGPAASAVAVPSTTPGELTLTELSTGPGELSASWLLADDGGLPSSVTVEVVPDAGRVEVSGTSLRVTGLTEGESYALRLTADNANGPGPTLETGPLAAASSAIGYLVIDTNGGISSFGDAPELDDLGITTGGEVVSASALPGANAALILTSDAVIWARGVPPGALATPGSSLDLLPGEAVVELLTGVDTRRAWVVTSTGRVITRGVASSFGDASAEALAAPIVAAAMAPDGQGYVMVSADGGVFAYGSASFEGRLTAEEAAPGVVDIVTDPDGTGYWIVTADGGVFAYEAHFAGSLAGVELNSPVVAGTAIADGYVLVADDGGVFNFTSGPFLGNLSDDERLGPVAAIIAVIG